jgi:hypothetical protein
MSQRSRLESALLQPERIANVFWRFRNELIIGFALRLIRLMTIGTICIRMLVVWECNTKIGDKAFCCREERFT